MTVRSTLRTAALVSLVTLTGCTPSPVTTSTPVASPPFTSPPACEPSPASTPTACPTPSAGPATPAGDRHAALFGGARTTGGTTYVNVDLVLFLTDGEAEDAAEALGEESPPPNDFFVLNHTTRLREYPVAAGVTVTTVMDAAGSLCPDLTCPAMDLPTWVAAATPDGSIFRSTPYWLTIDDGTVTSIAQQYVP